MNLELRDLGKPGESLGEVVHGFAAALRADIENAGDDTTTRIHDIRVGTKKLRALLRLASEAAPGDARLAVRLRAIRQAFSGSRDADVMRQRVAELFPEESGTVLRELTLEAPEAATSLPQEATLQLWCELDAMLREVNFAQVTRLGLVENATRSHRRARKLMRKCRETPEDDVLMHDWRKRTKDACYHAMALAAAKPMKKRIAPLDALAEKLGEYHDLSVLGSRAEGHDLISAVVNKRKQAIRRECFKAGEKIFRKKASKFRKKLIPRLME
jgi:CHAD domain-containing protein